ncbi:hypothetical protein TgHK011_004494 [Trichoderma gracile]|nr:hypothetical protein TgHK011_004494 [Trichoderma gracile]
MDRHPLASLSGGPQVSGSPSFYPMPASRAHTSELRYEAFELGSGPYWLSETLRRKQRLRAALAKVNCACTAGLRFSALHRSCADGAVEPRLVPLSVTARNFSWLAFLSLADQDTWVQVLGGRVWRYHSALDFFFLDPSQVTHLVQLVLQRCFPWPRAYIDTNAANGKRIENQRARGCIGVVLVLQASSSASVICLGLFCVAAVYLAAFLHLGLRLLRHIISRSLLFSACERIRLPYYKPTNGYRHPADTG